MSGIYIPKMEMPKNCYECPIAQGYTKPAYCGLNGSIPKLWKEFDDALEKEIKPDFCPLIAVPDHGGLVDANRLIEIALHLMHTAKNDDIANGVKWLWQYILEAPIIIEAEEGET